MGLGTVSSKLQAENYHFVKGNTTHLGQLQILQQKRISTFVQLTIISSLSRTKKIDVFNSRIFLYMSYSFYIDIVFFIDSIILLLFMVILKY